MRKSCVIYKRKAVPGNSHLVGFGNHHEYLLVTRLMVGMVRHTQLAVLFTDLSSCCTLYTCTVRYKKHCEKQFTYLVAGKLVTMEAVYSLLLSV